MNQVRDKAAPRPTPRGSGDGYRNALTSTVESISQYTVETDAEALQQFRDNLALAVTRLKASPADPPEAVITQAVSDIRGTLRAYRDRAVVYIQRLRLEVKAACEGLDGLLSTLQSGSSRSEQMLTDEIAHLRGMLSLTTLEQLRQGVEQSTHNLADFAERVRREKDSIIAQLKNEIQTLHRSLDEAQRAAKLDPVTGMFRKEELLRLLRRKIVAGEAFGVIHVSLQNLHELACEGTAAVVEEILIAFSRRMHNVVPGNAEAGEWDRHTFCILCPEDSIKLASTRLERSCNGRYVYMQEGISRSFNLQAVVSCLSRQADQDADSFVERLQAQIAGN